MPERLWNLITSTRFAIILFCALSVASVVGTLPDMDLVYRHPLFRAMIGMLALCTIACTLRRWSSVTWPVLVIHSGVLVVLAGGMMSWLGYVATVNAYEGDPVGIFFRWDIEQDVPLGFVMTIKRINTDYYPVPVKVGVMHGEEKKELFMLNTGESFEYDRYRIRVDKLEPATETLYLTIFGNGQVIGTTTTEDRIVHLPADFPYRFKLVAYQNPILKRMWVDLAISENGKDVVEGSSEVNAPLQWNGLSFYQTRIATDDAKRLYAGIQVVKDPGRPMVFAGMIITSLGGICAFARRKVWS